jgi:hypothetical protein
MSWEEFKEALVPAILTVVAIWATLVLVLTAGTVVVQ